MSITDLLTRLIEDIATAPDVDTRVRRDLLTDALLPLGAVEAAREANAIESHAYWVRCRENATREDQLLRAEAAVAAHRTSLALREVSAS